MSIFKSKLGLFLPIREFARTSPLLPGVMLVHANSKKTKCMSPTSGPCHSVSEKKHKN